MNEDDEKPRAYTVEEMRNMVIEHLAMMARYWATANLGRPEFKEHLASKGEILYRLEGLVFSFLVMLDGGSGDMPAFDLSPSPHEDDEDFHRKNGENWWPSGEIVNECQLHDLWSTRK